MKIFGKDGKEYATVKECIRADAEYDKKVAEEQAAQEQKKAAEAEQLAQRKAEISKRKKELSNAIEAATDNVRIATIDYNQAKERAENIIAEARKEAQSILEEAAKKLTAANDEKVSAISNFNKEFGPFTTVLTGDDAWNEAQRIQKAIDKQFGAFRNFFTWF